MADLSLSVAQGLDTFRARVLKLTLRSPLLRNLFCSRAKRLRVLFLAVLIFQLSLAVFFPIPILVIGPLLLGAPHLVNSLRYALGKPQSLFKTKTSKLTYSVWIWVAVAIARAIFLAQVPYLFEVLGMVALTAIWWKEMISDQKRAGGLFLVTSLLIVATQIKPLFTVAFLVLFHHFISFFHWMRSTKTPAEKTTVWISFACFFLVHVAIFTGVFDSWIGGSEWGGVPYGAMASTFTSVSQDPMFLMRCLVAYAFGQSMHYFIWLKCIPDQHHVAEMPTSFKQSLRIFLGDFGQNGAMIAFFFIVGVFTVALFTRSTEFRNFYFCIAAFHGFFEIFGLFLKAKPA